MDKYLILVEGSTDKEILDLCIDTFYKNLYGQLEIVSFDNPDRNGGTSQIVNFIQTLLNSTNDKTVLTRYVALFDNDTEGIRNRDIIRNYGKVIALSYPNLNCLRKYPTVSTKKKMNIVQDDINGRAAAIELYLPDSVLMRKSIYPSIIWYAYDFSVGKHQGSLVKNIKSEILKDYGIYAKQVKEGKITPSQQDWYKCIEIIEMLIKKLRLKR